MVSYLLAAYKVSIARACSVVGLHRSMWYYQAKKDDSEVVAKLTELAEDLPTRGFDVYYNRIRTEGFVWNRKRVLRVSGHEVRHAQKAQKACSCAHTTATKDTRRLE